MKKIDMATLKNPTKFLEALQIMQIAIEANTDEIESVRKASAKKTASTKGKGGKKS